MVAKYQGPAFRLTIAGDKRQAEIKIIQNRLNGLFCGPLILDGDYGLKTESSVRLFQIQNGLLPDGIIGYQTWSALFGVHEQEVSSHLLVNVLTVAIGEIGVKEVSINRSKNRGIRIDEYARCTGLNPEDEPNWCGTFTYFCFNQAANKIRKPNPLPRTGGVHRMWELADERAKRSVIEKPKPGWIWLADFGNGKGHMGIVRAADPDNVFFSCIDGNTNEVGSRSGNSVQAKTRRIAEITLGFLDYSFI